MQTIVYNDFAGGYFELYRGGAAVFDDKIIGTDMYMCRDCYYDMKC